MYNIYRISIINKHYANDITNVKCDPYKNELYINYSYNKFDYENKSMNPLSFNIVIIPWPNDSYYSFTKNNNSYAIDDDNNTAFNLVHMRMNFQVEYPSIITIIDLDIIA